MVEYTAAVGRKGKFDVIIGVGGGSILDVSKMASALVTNSGKTKDHFGWEKVPRRGKPTNILPPTSGTGTEVTKYAIFLDRKVSVKKAVASSILLPDVAIVAPMSTVSYSPHVTAVAGFDAYIHAVEPFISKNANPITDALSIDSIKIITKWLGPAFPDAQNPEVRYYMSLGSLMSGTVLNISGTSLVHTMASHQGGRRVRLWRQFGIC